MLGLAATELAVRDDLVWPWASVVVLLAVVLPLPFRRTHAGLVCTGIFWSMTVVHALSTPFISQDWGFYSTVCILIYPYALLRWASGRDIARAGLGIGLLVWIQLVLPEGGLGDFVSSAIVLALPAAVGAAVRFRARSKAQSIEQTKLSERAELARELHDTVAHHVSAIVIQAQAGRFLASQDSLDGAADALEVIEEEAARTLIEMRTIVSVLRDGASPEMTPGYGIDDIARMANTLSSAATPISVDVDPGLGNTPSTIDAAIFRIAQESVTNAVRHAVEATEIVVAVRAGPESVSVSVRDDGRTQDSLTAFAGFGLVGMSERTHLLGGTFSAGPTGPDGWLVSATFPVNGTGGLAEAAGETIERRPKIER